MANWLLVLGVFSLNWRYNQVCLSIARPHWATDSTTRPASWRGARKRQHTCRGAVLAGKDYTALVNVNNTRWTIGKCCFHTNSISHWLTIPMLPYGLDKACFPMFSQATNRLSPWMSICCWDSSHIHSFRYRKCSGTGSWAGSMGVKATLPQVNLVLSMHDIPSIDLYDLSQRMGPMHWTSALTTVIRHVER